MGPKRLHVHGAQLQDLVSKSFQLKDDSIHPSEGNPVEESMYDQKCDITGSSTGWDRAPCSACTIPNQIAKSIEFTLRGNCEK